MTNWITFYNAEGREVGAISADDAFDGEIDATIELLAQENSIPEGSISVGYVTRPRHAR